LIKSYESLTEEVDTVLPVEGDLPSGLRGTLYRNGPARFARGGRMYGHSFDGDGMVLRFAIGAVDQRRIRYRNRFVRTRELIEEERVDRILYRGFGTAIPGGLRRNLMRMRFKNPANTNVVYHAGKLLALWEGGLPHLLDPITLETLGRHDFDGALRANDAVSRLLRMEMPFSAHPRVDGALYNFGISQGRYSKLNLYRVQPDGRCSSTREVVLPGFAFMHDFALTPSWQVFFVPAVTFDMARAILGLSPLLQCLRESPGVPMKILLVPRGSGEPRWFTADPGFIFHIANAHEDARGRVIIDACHADAFPHDVKISLREMLAGDVRTFENSLTRFVIDPSAPPGTCASTERLSEHWCEMPRIHAQRTGQPQRYIFGIGSSARGKAGVFTSVLRHDVTSRQTLVRDFAPSIPGEPIPVLRPGGTAEDDGWVLTLVYDGAQHRSTLHILDARNLSTVCTVPLPHHVPIGLHGNFVPAEACPAKWET
jgi:all-trans-8'-apo-beta-carotenal 15,15'-oxygenase